MKLSSLHSKILHLIVIYNFLQDSTNFTKILKKLYLIISRQKHLSFQSKLVYEGHIYDGVTIVSDLPYNEFDVGGFNFAESWLVTQ